MGMRTHTIEACLETWMALRVLVMDCHWMKHAANFRSPNIFICMVVWACMCVYISRYSSVRSNRRPKAHDIPLKAHYRCTGMLQFSVWCSAYGRVHVSSGIPLCWRRASKSRSANVNVCFSHSIIIIIYILLCVVYLSISCVGCFREPNAKWQVCYADGN